MRHFYLIALTLFGCQSAAETKACTDSFNAIVKLNKKQGLYHHFEKCSDYEPIPALQDGARIRVHYAAELQEDPRGIAGLPSGLTRVAWIESYSDCELHGDTVVTQPSAQGAGCTILDSAKVGPDGNEQFDKDWCGAIGSGPPLDKRVITTPG